MSISKAMYSGVSGLSAESGALAVVGDNVANANTVGFKRSRATFENILGGAAGAHGTTGGGVRLGRAQQLFAQGALVNTGQPTDIALSGDGFFVVNGRVNGTTGNFYTRAGQLTVRNDGVLVNPEGLTVQSDKGAPIQLSTASLSPKVTTKLGIVANLDASATTPTADWDLQNPGTGSNLSTTMTVYDSLGKPHPVDVHFRKTGEGQWDVHVLAKGDELASGPAGQNVEIGAGNATFDASGKLTNITWTTPAAPSFAGATPSQALAIELEGTTQFGSASAINEQNQDGYASGDLQGVKIDPDGTVRGAYSNGQSVVAGRIAVARFRANDGLEPVGQNCWAATTASGDPAIGGAGDGGRGSIASGSLEQSNVDLAEQFVDLIAHQRGFQANSKTITTADQMLQELMTIKQ